MFEDIKNSIKDISEKLKAVNKKTAVDEYLSLMKEKAELEKKLNDKKIRFLELKRNQKERNKNNHIKFFIGGIIAKHYPQISKLKTDKEIEDYLEKILKIANQENDYYKLNADKFETKIIDGEEYIKFRKKI